MYKAGLAGKAGERVSLYLFDGGEVVGTLVDVTGVGVSIDTRLGGKKFYYWVDVEAAGVIEE